MANSFRTFYPAFNPVLRETVFIHQLVTEDTMTVPGTVNRSGLLLLCVAISSAWTWGLSHSDVPAAAIPWIAAGLVGGLSTALVTFFKKNWSPLTTPVYALFEGLVLGGIASFFEDSYPGIALQAIGLMFSALFALILAHKLAVVRHVRGLRLGMLIAMAAIGFVYLADIVLFVVFRAHMDFIFNATPLGIGVGLVVVVLAALKLILDFELIQSGVNRGAPKYMEWYGAFGLMVLLFWLPAEKLHPSAKLLRR